MTARRANLLVLATLMASAFLITSWGLHRCLPRIEIWRTLEGREEYSLALWTTAEYCWAVAALIGLIIQFVVCPILFLRWMRKEPVPRGFPVR
jgi:hypothetical protein